MEGYVVRRVVPSDNRCLFNAVGYVMDRERTAGPRIRQDLADAVASDPVKYSSVVLEKPNSEYCTWILNPQTRGGSLELAILAAYYRYEIAVYDIWTGRCILYGRRKAYNKRIMLIYDGLHYDALAFSPSQGAPENLDRTIFEARDAFIEEVEMLALTLVEHERRERNYTDPANFALRCQVCQMGVDGQ